jgi:hypothetical protein
MKSRKMNYTADVAGMETLSVYERRTLRRITLRWILSK